MRFKYDALLAELDGRLGKRRLSNIETANYTPWFESFMSLERSAKK